MNKRIDTNEKKVNEDSNSENSDYDERSSEHEEESRSKNKTGGKTIINDDADDGKVSIRIHILVIVF